VRHFPDERSYDKLKLYNARFGQSDRRRQAARSALFPPLSPVNAGMWSGHCRAARRWHVCSLRRKAFELFCRATRRPPSGAGTSPGDIDGAAGGLGGVTRFSRPALPECTHWVRSLELSHVAALPLSHRLCAACCSSHADQQLPFSVDRLARRTLAAAARRID